MAGMIGLVSGYRPHQGYGVPMVCQRCPNDFLPLKYVIAGPWAGAYLCRDCVAVVEAKTGCPHGAKSVNYCKACKSDLNERCRLRREME